MRLRSWCLLQSMSATTQALSPRVSNSVSRQCLPLRPLLEQSLKSCAVPETCCALPIWRSTMAVRKIEVRERVMARNNEIAAEVRARLAEHGVTAINLVSSPGAGKTTLLEKTLSALGEEMDIAVITGDV